MWVLLLIFLAAFGTATTFDKEESYEEKVQEAYDMLSNVPNAHDTMEFLLKAHELQEGNVDRYTASEESTEEELRAMDMYSKSIQGHADVSAAEINAEKHVGLGLFQGDIMLTREQADEILEDMEVSMGRRKKRQAYRDNKYPATLWSNGINYAFWNASNAARRVFVKATEIWRDNTCLEFREDSSARDKVWVTDGAGCWAHLGRIGGTQFMSLGDGCGYIGLGLHELGHTIGLYHTQSRHDRDNYITLHYENLVYDWHDQFNKESESTNYNYNITYDYGTVMHYSGASPGLSTTGKPYMMPHDPKYLPTLGSYILSFYEKLMVNLHYKCLDKCPRESWKKCENGGFPHPRDCSKCICPSGYGGPLCNKRPPGCGKELTATDEYQELWDVVGQESYDRYAANDDFYFCNYWIRGPPGSKIEVIFQNYTEGLDYPGCVWAGVEIKTLEDQRHTGYRFCSPEYGGTSLISEHDMVPVITYSRVYKVTALLRYKIHSYGSGKTKSTSKPVSEKTSRPTPTTTTTKKCYTRLLYILHKLSLRFSHNQKHRLGVRSYGDRLNFARPPSTTLTSRKRSAPIIVINGYSFHK
ncbi:Astacin (Peptidase M12A) [Parelaphostrongylus tenuis]|uniref:Zinc metalloproteinase n=1 Tax=Parelaphostrongylus tenuis TaxID=148309 RepID=A0AAD5QK69_PARTN|nr:Astacin (Peptidase M12A) [Parelaphostrongylus tenuis]